MAFAGHLVTTGFHTKTPPPQICVPQPSVGAGHKSVGTRFVRDYKAKLVILFGVLEMAALSIDDVIMAGS